MPSALSIPSFTKDRLERLEQLIGRHKEETWAILIAQVDPDGIGAAFIQKEIIERRGGRAVPHFGGMVGLPQNEKIVDAFQLEKRWKPVAVLPPSGPQALADSSKLKDSRFEGCTVDPERIHFVLDHHRDDPVPEEGRAVFIEPCGAASSLGYLLAREMGIELSRETATLALIGILSDTEKMTSASVTAIDRRAFAELLELADYEKVTESFRYEYPSRYYAMLQDCLADIAFVGPYLISNPKGLLTEKEGDYLSLVADRLRRHENAKTVIVWGVTETHLRASIRSKDVSANLRLLTDDLFGAGHGGGKNGAGGARVTFRPPNVPTAATAKKLIEFYEASFKERLGIRAGAKHAGKTDDNGNTAH